MPHSESHYAPLKHTVTLEAAGQKFEWGSTKNFVLFAGPDIIEDDGLVIEVGQELKKITTELGIPWILKCSYDKANRQSLGSFRGPGVKAALKSLDQIKSKIGCALLTDVHETTQVEAVAEVADVIQIPAFLCRQTDLVVAVAQTQKVMHIKKGQFMAPWDMEAITKKATSVGNNRLLLCERGSSFGYNRLVVDMTGLVEMRKTGFPVIMDVTHSTQQPGAMNGTSGGRRDLAPALARAAMAVGIDGLFIETHPRPDEALCDGPTSLALGEMKAMLQQLQALHRAHATV